MNPQASVCDPLALSIIIILPCYLHVIGLSSPEGLAVDWVSRTLYFTDSALDRIEVSDLDGNYRKVLISDNLTNPRSIVLEPSAG